MNDLADRAGSFRDKVVLVTGATRNTGLAIAEAFARAGATVALNGRKPGDVDREAERLRDVFGARVIAVPADISDISAVNEAFARVRSEAGRLDVLVNNAVVQGVGYSFVDTPPELLEEVFRINVFGSFYCAQQAARMMIEQGGGAIVNIGSTTALRAVRNRTAYAASKGAIEALTRAMALDLGPVRIRVNSVVAGYIHTDRWEKLTHEADRRRASIPLGSEAQGVNIADVVMFLASARAAHVHGASLVVDGGVTAQLVPADCDR